VRTACLKSRKKPSLRSGTARSQNVPELLRPLREKRAREKFNTLGRRNHWPGQFDLAGRRESLNVPDDFKTGNKRADSVTPSRRRNSTSTPAGREGQSRLLVSEKTTVSYSPLMTDIKEEDQGRELRGISYTKHSVTDQGKKRELGHEAQKKHPILRDHSSQRHYQAY